MNIAIMTNFQDFNPGYSLTGIVFDQLKMLSRYGHKCFFYTCERYNPAYDPKEWPENVYVKHLVPFGHLFDYQTSAQMGKDKDVKDLNHPEFIFKIAKFLNIELVMNEIDIVFTHDWIFTGWNLPYADGIKLANKKLENTIQWMHWIHSVPTGMRDWWMIKEYGPNHKIVFPNSTDRLRVAEQFRGAISDVRTIPHIKDIRTWYDFDKETCDFIDAYPGVMQADFVQIYPASTDRLFAKRVDVVSNIMSAIKARGFGVCLVIANQWATGIQRKEDIKKYYKFAESCGLERGVDFIFTSDWNDKYENGLPKHILRNLQLCSNLFIYPTREESFGLVGPEAALAGGFMVLNQNLTMMREVFGNMGFYTEFGSFTHEQKYEDEKKFYYDIGSIILGRCFDSEMFKTKTFCRKVYNYDNLYLRCYEPVMAELKRKGGSHG